MYPFHFLVCVRDVDLSLLHVTAHFTFRAKIRLNSPFPVALKNVSLLYRLSDRRGLKETGYYQECSADVRRAEQRKA